MSDASFASLGPTLLARKGGAKPAMRPQVAPFPGVLSGDAQTQEDQLEDLGWNDMGEANDTDFADDGQTGDETGSGSPVVREQQKRLAKRIAGGDAQSEAGAETPKRARPTKTKRKAKSKTQAKTKASPKADKPARRAAFTLRLDPDRHLKLRLAATMNGQSAQSLVTQALDAMLSEIADLDALAKRVKPKMAPRVTKQG